MLRAVGADGSALVRQSARLIVEEALEAAVAQELGRDYYVHRREGRGYRNSYGTDKVKNAGGVIELQCRR
jgi:transposase-like protein